MSELNVNEMLEFQAKQFATEMTLTVVLALLTATDKRRLGRMHDALLSLVNQALTKANAPGTHTNVPDQAKALFEAVVVGKLDEIFANAKNIR